MDIHRFRYVLYVLACAFVCALMDVVSKVGADYMHLCWNAPLGMRQSIGVVAFNGPDFCRKRAFRRSWLSSEKPASICVAVRVCGI